MGNREMWTLRKVRIGRGGYEVRSGQYYGYERGNHVYRAVRDNDSYTLEFRSTDRAGARAYVRQRHPHAQFYN